MFILGSLNQHWDIQHAPFTQYPRVGGPWSVTRPERAKTRLAAKEKFLEWAKDEFPDGFKVAVIDAKSKGLAGLGQRYVDRWSQDMNVRTRSFSGLGQTSLTPAVEQKPWYEKGLDVLIGSVQKVLPEYVKLQTDKKLLDINVSRMKAGLAPTGEFSMADERNNTPSTAYESSDTGALPPWLVPGALGLAALLLFTQR